MKFKILALLGLMVFLGACSKEGGKTIKLGPKVQGASENIAIDPIKLDQPDFGQITSSTPVVQFLNIRNIGEGVIDPVNVSITGIDGNSFSLLTPSCPALQAFSSSVCTIKIEFNPANKPNRLYFAELDINGLVFPFSAELAIRANGSPYFQFYQGREFAAETIDLGTTSGDRVINQVVTLRHLTRSATGNLPLIMKSADFSISRTACPAVEINGNGCTFMVSFNPTGKAKKTFKAPLSVSTIHTVELKATNAETGGRPQFDFYNSEDDLISKHDFGAVLIPEKKNVVLKIKNNGTQAGVPEISILPNKVYTISENSCEQSINPGDSCEIKINVVSVNRVTNNYISKVTSGSAILEMKSFIYSPSQCNLGTHIDPDKLVCVSDVSTEIIPNGIRYRDWIPSPAPGEWSDFTYSCTQPNYELNFDGNACIFKQRMLSLEVEGSGEIIGGESKLYNFNTIVNLRAVPAPFYAFKEWQGASCSGSNTTCTVTMNQVHNVRAVFYVPPLEISPNPFNAYINRSQQFTINGGVGPYRFILKDAVGTLSASGLYSGSSIPTEGIVEVKDSQERLVNVSLKVVGPFVLTHSGTINVTTDSLENLGVSGGLPPYTYNKISGVGSPGIGGYNTGSQAGAAVVQVVDGLGSIQTVNVNVVRPLQVNPLNFAQEVNKTFALQITQGIPPYTTSVIDGVGSINSNIYSTGSMSGTAQILVRDSMGREVMVNAVVVEVFRVLKESQVMETGRSITISATGGLEPYNYEIVSGGGTISEEGTYTSPSTPTTAIVRVTDQIGTSKDVTVRVFYPLTLNISNWKMEINQSKEIVPSGGASPYSYAVISGKGRMTGSSYSSDSVTTSVVEVTDSVGNKAQVNFTILPEFKLPKYQHNMLLSETYPILPTGGLPPYSYELVAGGVGSVSLTGTYTAPNQATNDSVIVTDSLGSTKQINFKVVRPLIASVQNPDIYVGGDTQIIVLDGLPPYTYRITKGLGVVNSTGAYSAPTGATDVEIEVVDAMTNKQVVSLKVYDLMVATPSAKNLLTNQTQQITVVGGKNPIAYRIVSGPGTVSSSGLYSSGLIVGDAQVEVKDSLSMTSLLNFKVVEPLVIEPDSKIILTEDSLQLIATKGLSPYVFDIARGSGSVNSNGMYTAGNIADAVRVRVTDAMGNTAQSNIQVILPLTVPNSLILTTVQKQIQLRPEGGLTPYIYSIQSGGGSVSATGLFTAPATPGLSVVKINDSSFNELTVTFDTKEALVITPQSGYLEVEKTKQYSSAGGVPPYSYSVFSGPGTIDANGLLTAGTVAGASTVVVSDSIGNTSEATLQILNKVEISPTSFSVVVNRTQNISVAGGLPPYTYTVSSGAGTISSGGVYTAPASAGSAEITVTDSLGTFKKSTVNIVPPLTLSPVASNVTVNQTQQFSGAGGLPPYTYSVATGSGTIGSTTGLFTASNTPGAVTVRVRDSLNNEKIESVNVVGPLTLLVAANISLLVDQSYSILVTGGLEPYSYTVTSGEGSVTNLGVYTAPNLPTDAVVEVADSLGNKKTVAFKVVKPLVVSPTPINIVVSQTRVINVSEGLPPYSYTHSGRGSFASSTRTYSSGTVTGTASILVKDAMNNQVTIPITVYASLQNSLSATSVQSGSRATFNISGGSGNFTVDFIQNANIGSSVRDGFYYAGYTQSNVSEQIRIVDNVTGETKTSSVINVTAMPSTLQKLGGVDYIAEGKGSAVDHNNSYAVVGSPLSGDGGVEIYNRVSNNWETAGVLEGSQSGENFGASVSLYNQIIAIGSPEYDNSETNSGRVSIFRFNSGNWNLEQQLESPILQAGENFGKKVKLFNIESEEWLAVSSLSNDGGVSAGAVYLYKNNGGNWTLERTIVGTSGDMLGYDIDAENGHVAIGVPFKEHTSRTDVGEVMMLIRSGLSWIDRIVRPSDAGNNFHYGASVAVDKLGRLAVGAVNKNGAGVNLSAGAVYSYYKDSANLMAGEKIVSDPFEIVNGKFGKHIELIEDYMAVSSEKVEGVTVFDHRNVYVYSRSVRGNNTNSIVQFGHSFSLSELGIFAGSPSTGEAMMFNWVLAPNWPFGTDGDLTIASGQTVNLTPGSVKDYKNLIIEAGGILNLTDGSALTIIGVKENLIVNGEIRGISGSHSGGTFSNTVPAKNGTLTGGEAISYIISQGAGGSGGSSRQNGRAGGGQNSGNGGGGAGEDGNGGSASVSAGGGGGPTTGGSGATSYSSGGNSGSTKGGGGGAFKGKHGQGIFFKVKGNISVAGKIDVRGNAGGRGGNGAGYNQGYTYNCNPYQVCVQQDSKGICTKEETRYQTCNGTYYWGGGGGGGGAGGAGGKIFIRARQEVSPLSNLLYSGASGGSGGTGGNSGPNGGTGATGNSGSLDNNSNGF